VASISHFKDFPPHLIQVRFSTAYCILLLRNPLLRGGRGGGLVLLAGVLKENRKIKGKWYEKKIYNSNTQQKFRNKRVNVSNLGPI
jgi:hypothetical protein